MNALKSHRVWMAGGTLTALLIAALAWFMVVNPELSNASSLRDQTTAAQDQNLILQSKLHKLQADNTNMDALVASLRQARLALPVDTDLAAFTRQLSGYASDSAVTISGISASQPLSTTSGKAAAGVPGTAVSPAGQLYALPVTVVIKGSAASDLHFLQAVQGTDKRAALVSSTQLTGDTTKAGSPMQLTIQLQLFVAPQAPGAEQPLAGAPK